ncbi:hypothetical protein RB614_27645 [Phytohabitans sp. ZYX-F-186]|uniref:HAF repeat-containing protein n=1 Tax=Phytohabitans maris TaxID=3071409 RepID=A0ABU0ZMQ1_9ACTN|nr:hypothetical protein [Phytohabitans sp. ZYX-F-186]MDQ7908306.1 hypothetical protein [Phytohabitans sp. ZYX-F-186]
MLSTARRRIRSAVTGVVVLSAVTVSAAGAAARQTPAAAPGDRVARLGASGGLGVVARLGQGAGPSSPFPGFVLERGRYTGFDPPPAATGFLAAGINDSGQISGEYFGPSSESGFLRDRRGAITKIDIPGATATEVVKINDRGVVAGAYSRTVSFLSDPDGMAHGFLLDRGKVTTIDVPGAAQTEASSVNDRGQVVGIYVSGAGDQHGFRWDKGRFTTLDVPGAAFTEPIDINDRGQVVGIYGRPGAAAIHGFLWDRGRYTTVDIPGASITILFGINDHGQIVASTLTDAPTLAGARGFLFGRGALGPVTPIRFPGAPRTLATGINDRGQIVGAYENPDASGSES